GLPDTLHPPAGADTEPDVPDRSRNCPPHRRPSSSAFRTKVFRLRGNRDSSSEPRAAAMNQTKSTYRCPSETTSLPSPASFLCHAASTQTTALQSSRGNKHRCRCEDRKSTRL